MPCHCVIQSFEKVHIQASNLFNLPLTFSLDESSIDVTQWRTFNFVYCHQVQVRINWRQLYMAGACMALIRELLVGLPMHGPKHDD
jgi:hypothetical protein